ncbi:MAG: ABC transporter permease [Acidobacteriota bacterium]
MSLRHHPARWPPHLRAGALLLSALALASACGPWLTADPTRITDPRGAALLPPGASVLVFTLTSGATVAAEAARREESRWVILRRGAEETLAVAEVTSVAPRRFWLGTDTVGRDVLARLLTGGRVSLSLGSLALLVALFVGITTGLASGWYGGLLDAMLMRLVDAMLAIPTLFLLLLLAAVFRPSATALVVALGLSSWMGVARLVRAQVLSLKEREFSLAARAIGAPPWRIAIVHLLPNTLTPLAQDAVLRLGDLILAEAALSFLGLGVQPPTPSWGNMVAEGESLLMPAWWLTLIPGFAVAATVIGAALVAEGLRGVSRAETSALA